MFSRSWVLSTIWKHSCFLFPVWTSGVSHALTLVSWFPALLAFLGALIWGNRNRAEEERCRNLLRWCFLSGQRWEAGQGGFPVSYTKCAGGGLPTAHGRNSSQLHHGLWALTAWDISSSNAGGQCYRRKAPYGRKTAHCEEHWSLPHLGSIPKPSASCEARKWMGSSWNGPGQPRDRERGPSRGQTQGTQQRSAGPAAPEEEVKGQRLVPGISPCRLKSNHTRRVPAGVICWLKKKTTI